MTQSWPATGHTGESVGGKSLCSRRTKKKEDVLTSGGSMNRRWAFAEVGVLNNLSWSLTCLCTGSFGVIKPPNASSHNERRFRVCAPGLTYRSFPSCPTSFHTGTVQQQANKEPCFAVAWQPPPIPACPSICAFLDIN